MDALIDIVVEIFGEIILELFVHFLAWLISFFVADIDSDSNKKRIIKISTYAICFIACIVLFILSFIYSKTAYALLASIFLSINIGILGIRLINKTYFNNKAITLTTIILTRISRITFYVLMFIFLDTLKTEAAKITLISISSTLMFIFTCIDIYTLLEEVSEELEKSEIKGIVYGERIKRYSKRAFDKKEAEVFEVYHPDGRTEEPLRKGKTHE